jgi:hypothetical protein
MIARLTKVSIYIASTLTILCGFTVRADVMPWSGASASVQVFGPPSTQSGSTASVSSQDTIPYSYWGPSYNYHLFTLNVNGSADAAATGYADNMLRAGATFAAPNPGTLGNPPDQLTVQSTASWTNDSLAIHGASIPNTVRLNFTVDFNAAYSSLGISNGTVIVTANHQTSTFIPFYTQQPKTQGFDSITEGPSNNHTPYGRHFEGLLHLDLPLSSLGISDPFQLSLQVTPVTGLGSNYEVISGISGDAILSLNSITTTDGKLLSDLGDTVTFASGMAAPVPEPSSFLVMGGLLLAAGVRRWFLRREPHSIMNATTSVDSPNTASAPPVPSLVASWMRSPQRLSIGEIASNL